jgi:hypothetical protein
MSVIVHETLAADVTAMLLQPREEILKRRAPRSPYVHDIRRKIKAAIAKPIVMLLAVSMADIDDGISAAVAVQPYEAMIALLRAHAVRRAKPSGVPWEIRVRRVMERETIAQGKLDIAQLRASAQPTNLMILVELRQASREYAAVQTELDALIDERWAEVELSRMGAA